MNSSNESNPSSLRDIYLRALDKKLPEAREAYLEGACGDNLSLRNKVDALLRENADDSFLEAPAVENNDTLPDAPTEALGTVIGRYKILQPIGEGGFGTVYMAEQKEPVKRRVALKIIKLGMDTKQVVARFEAERQALAMMDHPNIAKVLDAGATEAGRPYFVMELVRGISITKYCDENNLSALERLNLFMDVCSAIQHAHQKGIIHRDIKPSNIMITLHDGEPVPKVIDFGIAKATQQELTEKTLFTQYSQFIGTPAYMSPEQAEMSGLDVDTRSDIYSLGVLLYELLTGRTPLDREELMSGGYDEIRRRIREDEPSKPSTRVSTMVGEERTKVAKQRNVDAGKLSHLLRGDLDWVVMKALEKDRTRRYETANALRSDVQRFLNNEPVTAVKPSATYLLGKYVRRNKTVVGFAATIALLLITATTISGLFALKANKAEKIQADLTKEAEDAKKDLQKNYGELLIQQARTVQTARVKGYRKEVINLIQEAMQSEPIEKTKTELRNIAIGTILDPNAYPYEEQEFDIPDAEFLTKMRMFKDTCAFAYKDGHVGVHDQFNGKLLFELKGEHESPISSMVYLPMAEKWVSVDERGHIVVWKKTSQPYEWEKLDSYEVETNGLKPQLADAGLGFVLGYFTGDSLMHWPKAGESEFKNIKLPSDIAPFSSDPLAVRTLPTSVDRTGRWLAIGLYDLNKMLIHDLAGDEHKVIAVNEKEEPARMVPIFSEHNDLLMCFGMDYIGIYDVGGDWDIVAKQKDLMNTFYRHATFLKKDNMILFQGEDEGFYVWDFKENQIKESFEGLLGMPTYASDRKSLSFTLLSHWNNNRPLWKRTQLHSIQKSPVKILNTGNSFATGCSFSSTGDEIAVTSNASVRLFYTETLKEIPLASNQRFTWPRFPSFSSDDQLVVSNHSKSWEVYIWSAKSGRLIARQSCPNRTANATFCKSRPILGACGRGFVKLWNYRLETSVTEPNTSIHLKEFYYLQLKKDELVSRLRFSDDGRYASFVVGGIYEGQLYVLDLESKQPTPKKISESNFTVESHNGYDFLANSSHLVFWETNEREGRKVVWDVNLSDYKPWNSGWKSGNGDKGFYASPKFELGVNWGQRDGLELVEMDEAKKHFTSLANLTVPKATIHDVAWDRDVNTVAVALDNGEVHIWDIAELRHQLAELGLDWESPKQN